MALALCASACGSTQVYSGPRRAKDEVAYIGSGDATIHRIDGAPVPEDSWYEVLEGSHVLDITTQAVTPGFFVTTHHHSGLVSLCVKAKPARRYKIKATAWDGKLRVFIVDTDTGKPPKTPCGPDEDED